MAVPKNVIDTTLQNNPVDELLKTLWKNTRSLETIIFTPLLCFLVYPYQDKFCHLTYISCDVFKCFLLEKVVAFRLLTVSQTTNFGLFQIEGVSRRQFQI